MTQGRRVHVTIDPVQCGCTGYCVAVLPDVFELADDGPTIVRMPFPPSDLLDELEEAESLCPTHAIRVDVASEPGG